VTAGDGPTKKGEKNARPSRGRAGGRQQKKVKKKKKKKGRGQDEHAHIVVTLGGVANWRVCFGLRGQGLFCETCGASVGVHGLLEHVVSCHKMRDSYRRAVSRRREVRFWCVCGQIFAEEDFLKHFPECDLGTRLAKKAARKMRDIHAVMGQEVRRATKAQGKKKLAKGGGIEVSVPVETDRRKH
jgi:hypothetical protein